jgi:hypothetical protein
MEKITGPVNLMLKIWVSLRDTMNNIFVLDTVSRIPNLESKILPIHQKFRTYLGLDELFFLGKSGGHHE